MILAAVQDAVWPILAALGVLAVIFGGVIPNVRTQRAKATIDLQAAELQAEREARGAMQLRYDQALTDVEERCRQREDAIGRQHVKEISELRGRVDAMTPEFARTLADLVVVRLLEEGINGGR